MDRDAAYQIVRRELRQWGNLSYQELVDLVGQLVYAEKVWMGNELVEFEVRVFWEDRRRRTIRVEASGFGPSCFRIDKVEEKIVVSPPG